MAINSIYDLKIKIKLLGNKEEAITKEKKIVEKLKEDIGTYIYDSVKAKKSDKHEPVTNNEIQNFIIENDLKKIKKEI